MRRLLLTIILASCAAVAEARPLYLRAYQEVFPPSRELSYKCQLCHYGESKKNRHEYGQRVEAKLGGKKNIQDIEEIRQILRELGPFPGRIAD